MAAHQKTSLHLQYIKEGSKNFWQNHKPRDTYKPTSAIRIFLHVM